MEFYVWRTKVDPGCCTLGILLNIEDAHDIKKGILFYHRLTDDACFSMDPNYPKNIKLAAQVYNSDGLIVVNNQLLNFLKTKNIIKTEFLQVSIINHKGRVASNNYWIVNPYNVIDCIDKNNSDLVWGAINKESIVGAFKLELLYDQISTDTVLFRPKHLTNRIFIRSDLAKEIMQQNFNGTHFVPLEEIADAV